VEICSVEKKGYDYCLDMAVKYLLEGMVISFPTETFYALGALYSDEAALKRIAELKDRPEAKSFSMIIGSKKETQLLSSGMDTKTRVLTERFWPGPLTVVLPAKAYLSRLIRDERNTVAVRIPGPSFALDLARTLSIPITATSANPSGLDPARRMTDVLRYFPDGIDLLVDGGECTAEKPSTIIEIKKGIVNVLREGAIPREKLPD